MIWRNPVAWLGLATLLIPLAIHLLVRHRAEPRPFPSLRFVQPTRLASVRRKMISDWPLLAIRMLMLAVAVAALADPLWQSASRRAEWSERQARAIVVDTTTSVTGAGGATADGTGAARALAQREAASAFEADTIETTDVADGIRRASDWLRTAPPARRELVVISDFQLGALDAVMLRDLPAHTGIRFVRTPGAPVTRTADGQPRTQRAATGTAFTLRSPRVTLNANETAVTWIEAGTTDAAARVEIDATASTTTTAPAGADITLRPFDLKLRGSAADRPFLLAAAEAVLTQGVPVASGTTGTGKSATIIVANESGAGAASLIAPWQSDVAREIATDTALARAAGHAMLETARGTAASVTSPAGASTSSGAPAATGGPATTASGAARAATSAAESRSSGLPSSEATAKTRRASSASSDVPAPWTVLMRDADGAPAILAAADGAAAEARLLVWSRLAAGDETTALLIRATLRALAGPEAFGEAEVMTIPDATLAQWQRPASDPPASEWRDVDGNDRRWWWGAVLALIVAEHVIRRRTRHAETQPDGRDGKVFDHAA